MEAKKFHDPPSSSWKIKKASCIISPSPNAWESGGRWCNSWSKSQDPRTKSTDVWGEEKVNVSAQAKRVNLLFLCHFALFRPSTNRMMSMNIGIGDLYSVYWLNSNINLFQKCPPFPSDTTRNNVFLAIWAAVSSVKLMLKINCHKYVHV